MITLATALLLDLTGASVVQPPRAQPTAQDTVVVTGRRLRDYRRALDECLARNCPPDEDIAATMALAEALFMEGEYQDARNAIRESIGRNRREAATYPEPVADLFRANARVSRHLGMDRDAQLSIRQTLRSLQAGLPTEDHRHFGARIEIAQSLLAFGRYVEAEGELRELIEIANAAGRQDVADLAQLRLLWVGYLRDPTGPTVRRLTALAETRDPARRALATGAQSLLVRIYSERGDTARADALVAELARAGEGRRLLYAPRYELLQQEDMRAIVARMSEITGNTVGAGGGVRSLLPSSLVDRMVDNFDDKWIDVGFWITADGLVEDLSIVRRGRGGGGWEEPLLGSIRGRRYTASNDGGRTYRLERYTYTSEFRTNGTGSRIAQRSPRARVEYMDLTTAPPRN